MTFPYFGRKARIAHIYPPPLLGVPTIEPFAGSMSYTLHWRPTRAIGMEADPRVVEVWKRLSETFEVPRPPLLGSRTDDLLAMLCTYSEHSLTSRYLKVTSRMLRDWESVHLRAIQAGPYVRSVDYRHGDYRDLPDVEATWFIDPPYQKANRRGYRYGASGIDFEELARWCMTRRGLVIVCEQDGADWLPFKPLTDVTSHRGAVSREVVWIKEPVT